MPPIKLRLLVCVVSYFLLVFSPVFAYSQDELAQLDIKVQSGNNPPVPIHEIPKLGRGDRLTIKVLTDSSQFAKTGYKEIGVLFVPGNFNYLEQLKTKEAFQQKEFRENSTNIKHCFKNCEFVSPNYENFPIVFFITSSNYEKEIKKTIDSTNYTKLRDFGKQTLELYVAERKISFLKDISEIIDTEAATEDFITSLYLKANEEPFKLFKKADKTDFDCNKATAASNSSPVSASTNSSTPQISPAPKENKAANNYKAKLKCLVENNQDLIANFKRNSDLGTFNKKDLIIFFGKQGVAQLLKNFPSVGIYFEIAKIALQVLELLLRKDPLVLTSGFTNKLDEKGAYQLMTTPPSNPQEESAKSTPPPSNSQKAVFFAPLAFRDDVLNISQLDSIKIEPLTPCSTKGENFIEFKDRALISDPLVNDINVKIENSVNPSQNFNYQAKISDARNAVKFTITEEEWNTIRNWENVKGQVSFRYGSISVSPKSFEGSIAKKSEILFTAESINSFRKGKDNVLVLGDNKPNCLKEFRFVSENNSNLNQPPTVRYSGKEVKINKSNVSELRAGKVIVQAFQYSSEEPIVMEIELKDDPPKIKEIRAYEGDNFGFVDINRVGELRKAKGKAVILDKFGENPKEVAVNFDIDNSRFIYADSNFKTPRANNFLIQLKITLDSQEEVISEQSFVKKRRPVLVITQNCGENSLRVKRETSFNSPIEVDECVTPIDINEIRVEIKANTNHYKFVNKREYDAEIAVAYTPEEIDEKSIIPFKSEKTTNISKTDLKIAIRENFKENPFNDVFLFNEGAKLFVRIIDEYAYQNGTQEQVKSDWYQVGQKFVDLPEELTLDCSNGKEGGCVLSGDLEKIRLVSVTTDSDGKPIDWKEVDSKDLVSLSNLNIAKQNPTDVYFFVKVHNDERPIKIKYLSGNPSMKFLLTPTTIVSGNLIP